MKVPIQSGNVSKRETIDALIGVLVQENYLHIVLMRFSNQKMERKK
tara:strand:- start:974 stop:1111 length:138 start_codon:yes stop_codon:yes gene_type:complete